MEKEDVEIWYDEIQVHKRKKKLVLWDDDVYDEENGNFLQASKIYHNQYLSLFITGNVVPLEITFYHKQCSTTGDNIKLNGLSLFFICDGF